MSSNHPIIAVTGSSGAGTTNVKTAFERIFEREGINAAIIEGDSFHRYDREAMQVAIDEAAKQGAHITHFGPEGNLFDELEALFKEYSQNGSGKHRYYIHNEDEAIAHHSPPGTMTPWESIPTDTDLLFYEGLHGALITETHNIAQYADLLIGVVPIINLEWMQKIQRDREVRGYSAEAATHMILSRMPDYVHYITPQFSHTDINFQRVPTIDTSNPFAAEYVPSNDQSFSVVHIRNMKKLKVDFRYLLEMLDGSFMSSPDTIVVPAGKNIFSMEIILKPVIEELMANRNLVK